MTDGFNAEEIEHGRWLFAQACGFVRGVVKLDQLPPADLAEVAFVGRSNVGKSSLVNALTGRSTLARTSNTPGRTRELNFFRLGAETGPALYLVDLPGYGYARVPRDMVQRWTELVRLYLRGRPNLKRVLVLVDSRHGIKASDEEIMDMLDEAAVSYQIVLTKADALSRAERDKRVAATAGALEKRSAAFPVVLPTSSRTGEGIGALREAVARLMGERGAL